MKTKAALCALLCLLLLPYIALAEGEGCILCRTADVDGAFTLVLRDTATDTAVSLTENSESMPATVRVYAHEDGALYFVEAVRDLRTRELLLERNTYGLNVVAERIVNRAFGYLSVEEPRSGAILYSNAPGQAAETRVHANAGLIPVGEEAPVPASTEVPTDPEAALAALMQEAFGGYGLTYSEGAMQGEGYALLWALEGAALEILPKYTAEENAARTALLSGSVYVRTGPGANYEAVGKLSGAESVTILEEGKDGEGAAWYRVEAHGMTGWISARYADPEGDDAKEVWSFLSGEEDHSPRVTANTTINVRSGIGSGAEVVGKLEAGATAVYLGETAKDENGEVWVQISFASEKCWVSAKYVTLPETEVTP